METSGWWLCHPSLATGDTEFVPSLSPHVLCPRKARGGQGCGGASGAQGSRSRGTRHAVEGARGSLAQDTCAWPLTHLTRALPPTAVSSVSLHSGTWGPACLQPVLGRLVYPSPFLLLAESLRKLVKRVIQACEHGVRALLL